MKSILVTSLLAGLAMAANPIFKSTPYDECNTCLDNAVAECTGGLDSPDFGTCMCNAEQPAGDGYRAFANCLLECINLRQKQSGPISVTRGIETDMHSYCARWFPDKYCRTKLWDTLTDEADEKYCGGSDTEDDDDPTLTDNDDPTLTDDDDPTLTDNDDPTLTDNDDPTLTDNDDPTLTDDDDPELTDDESGSTGSSRASNQPNAAMALAGAPAWLMAVGLGMAVVNL
ncbi:hypothetical protein VTJ49DRAFT_2543 [Mycothermus thermophilus]|uniref:Extracellular membrane protein CFEM domain-containing protein n=1 Tax=Humicola insolens TaxID=85995 RepID=A0ABR3V9N3_HUMIN